MLTIAKLIGVEIILIMINAAIELYYENKVQSKTGDILSCVAAILIAIVFFTIIFIILVEEFGLISIF